MNVILYVDDIRKLHHSTEPNRTDTNRNQSTICRFPCLFAQYDWQLHNQNSKEEENNQNNMNIINAIDVPSGMHFLSISISPFSTVQTIQSKLIERNGEPRFRTVASFIVSFCFLFLRCLQLGVWRVSLQNVSICSCAQLHSFHFYSDDHLHGEIFCDHLSDYLQTDFNANQTTRKYFSIFYHILVMSISSATFRSR